MIYTIELPDGQVVGANAGLPALASVKLTAAAFPGSEADPGGVCATELCADFYGRLSLAAGDALKLYRDGQLLGTFTAEKPEMAGQRLRVLAYDAVAKLDKDLTAWLAGLAQWPYALSDFAAMVCRICGVTLTGDMENADWLIPQFRARNITGRQLLQWVCQAGCRFCRATPEGNLRLDWVHASGITLRATGEHFYFGGMTCAEHTVPTPDGVQIALTDSDVGVVSSEGCQNLLRIQGNYLLCGCKEAQAQAIAKALAPAYTPCTLETVTPIAPGQLFTVETEEETFTALAMTVEEDGGRFRVSGTGSPSRDASSAICRGDYRAMSGRVLELSLGLQGVNSRLAAYEGDRETYSQLSMDVDALTGRVGSLEGDVETAYAQLSLRTDGMEMKVVDLTGDLTRKADSSELEPLLKRFRFDGDGMTITETGGGMFIQVSEEQVAFRDGTVITPQRMTTTDLQVANSLSVGGFALIPRSSGNLSLRYTG